MPNIIFRNGKSVYFADRSETLTVGSSDPTSPMTVTARVGSSTVASFSMEPYLGQALIPVGDILRTVDAVNGGPLPVLKIEVSQAGSSQTLSAGCLFCRRFGGGSLKEAHSEWLTSGPRERATYPGAPETLPFVPDGTARDQRAMIRLEYGGGVARERLFATLGERESGALDVSPLTVMSFAADHLLPSPIAYSLWIEYTDADGGVATGSAVRFLIGRDRLGRKTYRFVGGRGAYEYIHATGKLSLSIDSDTATFMNSGSERERANDSIRVMEQNSGHLGSAAEAGFWLDFLSSRERLVREADGTERVIIVESADPSVELLRVGELTFRWHYGDRDAAATDHSGTTLTGITIYGPDLLQDSGNETQLGIGYAPATTTQTGVVWSIEEGSAYASLSGSGLLTVKEGTNGETVTVKAVSVHNPNIQDTKTITVYHVAEGTASYSLNIVTNVDSPVIAMKVDGVATDYFGGMLLEDGSAVELTVSKAGYATISDSFTMDGDRTEYYTLIESMNATVSHATVASSAAQRIILTISDPDNHGWAVDWGQDTYYGLVTGYGTVSGDNVTTPNDDGVTGTGDAVIYIMIPENTGSSSREIPRYTTFRDRSAGTSKSIWLTQEAAGTTTVAVTAVSLDKSSLSLQSGGTATLTATVAPSNATNKAVSWKSSNTSAATVSQEGKVTAVAAGSASITATATDGSGKSASCAVTVKAADIPVTGIALDKSSLSLHPDDTATLTTTVTPSNATNKTVAWESSNSSVATVSQSGKVTAVAAGSATITATAADGSGKSASCAVKVEKVVNPGSMSAEDISAESSATSASTVLTLSDMSLESLVASCPASWVQDVYADVSGSPYRVRVSMGANTSTSDRTATVTVRGLDTSGNEVSCSFTITQKGYVSGEVACTGMSISGNTSINNTANAMSYQAAYSPARTTQRSCVWSLTGADGNPTALAELSSVDGNLCEVTVKEGASGLRLILTATNTANPSVHASVELTATYIYTTGKLSAFPSRVSVGCDSVTDNTPYVTAKGLLDDEVTIETTGFISGASIDGDNRLVTVFGKNSDSPSSRTGTVTLKAVGADLEELTAVVTYTQDGMPDPLYGIGIKALSVEQNGDKAVCRFAVEYTNGNAGTLSLTGLGYSLTGKTSDGSEVFTRTGDLMAKSVAGMSAETEYYTIQWTGSLGQATVYALTVADSLKEDTYEGDGKDIIVT